MIDQQAGRAGGKERIGCCPPPSRFARDCAAQMVTLFLWFLVPIAEWAMANNSPAPLGPIWAALDCVTLQRASRWQPVSCPFLVPAPRPIQDVQQTRHEASDEST